MAENHKHGEMDISDHEKTFECFFRFSAYVAAFAICLLLFIALVNG